MLSKAIIALLTAGLLQDVVALGPRQHGHQHLHEKRAIVTEVVTQTSYVYVTVYPNKVAPATKPVSAKKFYTKSRKRPSYKSSKVAPSSTPPAAVTAEALPRPPSSPPSAPLAAPSVAPPAPVSPPADPAPAPAPAPAPVPAEPAPAPVPETSSGPAPPSGATGRGLAFNDGHLLKRFLGQGSRISWTYNWAQTDDSDSGLEFVPMCWGITKGFPATWAANAQKMINAGAKALFSFNEPDHAAQANLSPQQAAASHKELMNPFQGKALIGAPAITNSGNAGEGVQWLQRWFEACAGECAVDFVNIHIYGFDTNMFLQHLINVHNQFKKPVWITEFAFDGSESEVDRQLQVVIDQIEHNSTFSFVHRYSYFMAAEGMMVKGNSMSTYGNTFAYAS